MSEDNLLMGLFFQKSAETISGQGAVIHHNQRPGRIRCQVRQTLLRQIQNIGKHPQNKKATARDGLIMKLSEIIQSENGR